MQKPRIELPIVVEGRYDKNTLMQIFDATVISVGGFAIFNSREKQALLRRLGERGIIILTDPDGGGRQIRSFLNGIIPPQLVHNAYVPRVEGKERRKRSPSRSGVLGVEGQDRETLLKALAPFVCKEGRAELNGKKSGKMITKVDFFLWGLSGGENSSMRREALALSYGLPPDMTANALIEALNLLSDRDEVFEKIKTAADIDG